MKNDPPRRRPTQQQVLDMKAGLDQGGRRRTWDEVVELTGFSQKYLYRIAAGTTGSQPVRLRVIDPRDYDPNLAAMTDEQVRAWQENPHCLCGCNEPTLQEHSRTQRVPRGAYRLYRASHFRRHPDLRARFAEANKSPQRVAAIKNTKAQRMVAAEDVLEELWRWHNAVPGRTMAQAAELSRMSLSHLNNLGRQTNVRRLTAAKIYAAIGVPMTRELGREYRRFLRNRHLTGPAPIIVD